MFFHHLWKGEELSWLPVLLLQRLWCPSKRGCTLRSANSILGKNCLPECIPLTLVLYSYLNAIFTLKSFEFSCAFFLCYVVLYIDYIKSRIVRKSVFGSIRIMQAGFAWYKTWPLLFLNVYKTAHMHTLVRAWYAFTVHGKQLFHFCFCFPCPQNSLQ